MNWLRRETSESAAYRKAVRRLETVSSEEILRYVDNTHSALGQTVSEIRKSLSGSKAQEALPLLDVLETGTDTIRAAASVLRSRQKTVDV